MIDMDKGNLNKLVTNYPVELTPEEVENLSQTLSSVRTAREDDKTYTGEGFVNVNNTNNVISLTNEANEKLNQPIPTKVSDLTDSASYQTVSGMDAYLTKTSASENLAPLSITNDIESLKNASSDWNKVSAKLDTTAFSTVSGNYAFKNDLNDYYQKTETSSKGELDIAFESKQDKLIFGYDENNAISSINNTSLAGQDVTTYSAGQYIEIDENNTISVTGLLPLDEYSQYEPVLIGDSNITATSSKVDSHTQWNLSINSKPVVIDTKLVGENSITAHTTNVSGEWVVGLEESAHNAITSVAGIATDVGTLKTASAGWDKVSAKLDVTSFSTVSGTFLTEIPDTYATKNDLNTASSTLTSIDNDLSGHIDYVSAHAITSLDDYYTKTQVDSTFALKTEIPTTVTQLTDSGNYYQKTETSSNTEITNALNTKVDNPSQQTGLLVYDGDISAWVSMPPDTTIVQGKGSITANYESDSTYTVSLLASAENALKKVVNKIDTTAVEQKYQTKDDMSNYLTTSVASTTYQPIGDYATTSDISDMATQTWVGQQGFYTKASADNDYAPKTITATVNTLTGASASWNEVSAKLDSSVASTTYQTKEDMNDYLTKSDASTNYQPIGDYLVSDDITGKLDKSIYSNASGNWENTYNTVNQYSAEGTWLTAHQSLTNYYTKSETSGANELADEFTKYVTSSNVSTPDIDYVMTTTGWKVLTLPGGGMTQVIHDITLTGQGNDDSKLGVAWSALSGNTINSAKSAGSAESAYIASLYYDNEQADTFNIAESINSIYNNMITTSGISPDNGISGSYNSQAQKFELGLTQTAYNSITSVSSKLDTTAAEQNYLTKATYEIDSATFLTKSSADNDYAPKSITATVNTLTNASAGWDDKVDKPTTSFVDKYLVLRTDNDGNVSGWYDFQDISYSKAEALETFVATANIDTTTLSGDGKSVSTKLGVNTDVIATSDYVNSSFLPTSGGTVSGELVVSASTETFDSSYVKCVNNGNEGYSRFGVGSYGEAIINSVNGNNNVKVNVKYSSANNNELIQVQKDGTDIGFLIPAVTSTTTAGLTNDGILHIILES